MGKSAFPSYEEFEFFLDQNRQRKFNEGSFWACSMAECAQGPVSEGYQSDVDLDAPDWFLEFEERTGCKGLWRGSRLLKLLRSIGPNFVRSQSSGGEEPAAKLLSFPARLGEKPL